MKSVADMTLLQLKVGITDIEATMGIGLGTLKALVDALPDDPAELKEGIVLPTTQDPLENWAGIMSIDISAEIRKDLDPGTSQLLGQIETKFQNLKAAAITYGSLTAAINAAQDEVDAIDEDLHKIVRKGKKVMKDFFQSPYLLPSLWFSMFPTTVPYGGGVHPFGGIPSTVPGMIYLALLLIDAIEEEQHDKLNAEVDCEDEL